MLADSSEVPKAASSAVQMADLKVYKWADRSVGYLVDRLAVKMAAQLAVE